MPSTGTIHGDNSSGDTREHHEHKHHQYLSILSSEIYLSFFSWLRHVLALTQL